jgi:hypothetical protein
MGGDSRQIGDTDGLEVTVRRSVAAAGSAVFFLVAPTMVAVVVPWLLTGWQVGDSWPGPVLAAVAGVIAVTTRRAFDIAEGC